MTVVPEAEVSRVDGIARAGKAIPGRVYLEEITPKQVIIEGITT